MKTLKFLTIALFVSGATFAQTKEVKVAPAAPAVIAAPQVASQLKWDEEMHDFGTIEQNKPVTYKFTYTNTSNKDVLLTAVKPGCGCTAANYTKTAVKPGEKGFVEATYNAAAPNDFSKVITITTSEENSMPKIISFKGTVKPSTPVATPSK